MQNRRQLLPKPSQNPSSLGCHICKMTCSSSSKLLEHLQTCGISPQSSTSSNPPPPEQSSSEKRQREELQANCTVCLLSNSTIPTADRCHDCSIMTVTTIMKSFVLRTKVQSL